MRTTEGQAVMSTTPQQEQDRWDYPHDTACPRCGRRQWTNEAEPETCQACGFAGQDSVHVAHVADAIDRVGGDRAGFGYDETAAMADDMLWRFPAVYAAVTGYVADAIGRPALDDAVLDALAAF
jgi:ribosomal protein L37E